MAKILVTGATGNVGRLVVEQLAAAGADVRALSRSIQSDAVPNGVEVVQGDLANPASIETALTGVDRLFLFPMARTAREVVARAKKAGVRRIVVLSSGAVTMGVDTDFHLPVEQAVQESGLEWTFVRPGEFAINKLALWGPSIRAERVVRDPFPDAAWFPVHERDIADTAVAALLTDEHINTAHTLNGPDMISHRDQVAAIAAALKENVELITVTVQEAKELYLAQGGFAADNVNFLLGFEDYTGTESNPDAEQEQWDPSTLPPMPTLLDATGQTPRTFAQWAHDHVDDFR